MSQFLNNIRLIPRNGSILIIIGILLTLPGYSITKTSVMTGNWNDPNAWSPAGVPVSADDAIIQAGHTITLNADQAITALTVDAGATLTWNAGRRITITGAFTVNGTANMNGGLLTIAAAGQRFSIGASGTFIWDPGVNTSAEATLFTRGVENFASTSTLVIRRWFNYGTTLGQYITGDFGNLTINTPGTNNTIVEWNQRNQFQAHRILGRLTVDQGWLTLDKQGLITVTSIGSIVLTGMNSTLYCHNGNHPSSFSIVTTSITNNGGTFIGLNDGNGNITVHTVGDFINYGNVKLINNSGVLGVANGNAVFRVDGTFTQHSGDARIIYNITTTNSGTYTATFGNIVLNGGIFMGQTACHTAGGTNSFNVTSNFTINFRNATDKFRATSVTTLGSMVNNVRLNMVVTGNLSLSGVNNSEFTSSASSGNEQIIIGQQFTQSGTTCSFNYGTLSGSHPITMNIGSYTISGGSNYFSRNNNTALVNISNGMTLTGGTTVFKGGTGTLQLNCRSFNMSAGNCYLHNNTGTASSDQVSMTVNGNFRQSGGTIFYSDNTSTASATNTITLNGDSVSFLGTGVITRAGAGTIPVFGELNYNKTGTMIHNRASTHLIEQTIQNIPSGVNVDVIGNTFQVSSHSTNTINHLWIRPGGALSLNNAQLLSNGRSTFCNFLVDSNATLRTGRSTGLFDGTINGAINPSGNLSFVLNKFSIVEYNGFINQRVTGLSSNYSSISNKYGILRINLRGTTNAALVGTEVFVRTGLELNRGELRLNRNTLTVENGTGSAITRQLGYIVSEDTDASNMSALRWQNIQSGLHIIPFGISASTYLPVSFTPFTGLGNEVIACTRAVTPDNLPYPAGVTYPTSIYNNQNTVDRWWFLRCPSMKADMTVTYASTESPSGSTTTALKIIPHFNTGWGGPAFGDMTTTGNTNQVTASGVFFNNHFMVCNTAFQSMRISNFNADIEDEAVVLEWTVSSNARTTIEKSSDGENFEAISVNLDGTISGSDFLYTFTDQNLSPGRSYYRVKIELPDGTFAYSDVREVHNSYGNKATVPTEIESVSPNPFSGEITVKYSSGKVPHFALFNQAGQLVHEQSASEAGSSVERIGNLDSLPSGIYFLVMENGTEKKTKKIIKQ